MPKACRKWIWVLLLLGALSQLTLGCSTIATSSSKATGVDLAQYRTFEFAEAQYPSDLRFFTPTNQARVQAAIRTQLEQRGLRLAHPADLQLCMYLKTQTKSYDKAHPSVQPASLGANLGTYYGLTYNNDWGTQNIVAYPEGTLVVQAVDVKQNRKVWEGIATSMLHRNLPEKQREARIREAVAGMFKGFPKQQTTVSARQ
jgi:hypothetical protein